MKIQKTRIGLECHVQLTSKTKLFCGCPNKFITEPNVNVCELCLGLPGSKPRLNKKAVEYALKIALALNCKIPSQMFFSRKTYFYPDLAKNYQITQYDIPIASKGFVKVNGAKINISRINLEEDPARIVHIGSITSAEYTLLDYNRSGTPLCEIVTDPDFTSSREAKIFLQELSRVLKYLDVYNPDIEGSLRVDANISLGKTRVEVKNISGFKEVERALNYEIIRQKNLLSKGKAILRETRGWDADAGITRSLRTKEDEDDYGYITDTDIPSISITKHTIEEIERSIPELAEEKLDRYIKKIGVGYDLAVSIISEPDLAGVFEEVAKKSNAQLAAKWFAGEIKKTLNYNNLHIKDTKIKPEHIIKLLKLVENKTLTETTAEQILREMIGRGEDPEHFLEHEGLSRIYDEHTLTPVTQQVLDENPNAILDYKSGKNEALNFLIGAVMKKTKGRGDPDTIRRVLSKMLQ